MNQQPTTYPQYPPPQQVPFTYPSNPYPPQAQQTVFAYPAPHQQQQQPPSQQRSRSQFFGALPRGVQHDTQQLAPQPPQRRRRQRSSIASSSRPQNARSSQTLASTPSASPVDDDDAPPAEPSSPPDGMEPELIDPLGQDGQTNNEDGIPNNNSDNEDDQEQNEISDAVFNLPPPPEGTYASEQELERALHAWSLEHGYELVRRASKKNAAGELYKRYYHCSRHGKVASTGKITNETRQRVNRRSNRQGCPMSLAAVAVNPANPSGEWQVRNRKTHHNHGPLDALTMAGHRRRARMGGVEKSVDGLFTIGTPTSQVLQFLQRTNPDGLFTRTDVANMKLKYKKYGTCVNKNDQINGGRQSERRDEAILGSFNGNGGNTGLPSACTSCRRRRVRCDSVRPVCGKCLHLGEGEICEYDHQPGAAHPNMPAQLGDTMCDVPTSFSTDSTFGAQTNANAALTRQILADLQTHSASHSSRQSKLSLNSSSVEILSHSSCGDGSSYKTIPVLSNSGDWQTYCDSFLEASLKEGTYDVLTGSKIEPAKPADACEVEEWNEYVKRLAIFNRRNSLLLGAIFGSVAPSFRSRIQAWKKAAEAWAALEEICSPKDSVAGFEAYEKLHNVSLQNSQDLRDYIGRLEVAYNYFNRLRTTSGTDDHRSGSNAAYNDTAMGPVNSAQPSCSSTTPLGERGGDVFPEDALVLVFLKNLSPDYRPWIESLCATSNLAGFGTGSKVGFRDVARRAMEWTEMQQRRSGRIGR